MVGRARQTERAASAKAVEVVAIERPCRRDSRRIEATRQTSRTEDVGRSSSSAAAARGLEV